MKRYSVLLVCSAIALVSSGCISIQTNTKAPMIPTDAVQGLNVGQPVALRNAAPESGKELIGNTIGRKVYADLYKYTESSINYVKKTLEANDIVVADDANKVLELTVFNVTQGETGFVF